jgi:putative transposase
MGGLNSKLYAVCNGEGRPLLLLLTEGQTIDRRGAAVLLHALPPARELLADRGYDNACFRAALVHCIPSAKSCNVPLPYDKDLYREHQRIENMFGKLEDWRRIATSYDRCAHAFFSASCIATAVSYWL